jgi:hypothetical protein
MMEGTPPDCPECPTEPWVVLSEFTVDEAGNVAVQECACRRQVAGFGAFWWSCKSEQISPDSDGQTP